MVARKKKGVGCKENCEWSHICRTPLPLACHWVRTEEGGGLGLCPGLRRVGLGLAVSSFLSPSVQLNITWTTSYSTFLYCAMYNFICSTRLYYSARQSNIQYRLKKNSVHLNILIQLDNLSMLKASPFPLHYLHIDPNELISSYCTF